MQILARPLNDHDDKPQSEPEPYQATARKQLEIIVVGLLGSHCSRRIMNSRNRCPVCAHPYSQNRMRDKQFPAGFPDLIPTNASPQTVTVCIKFIARLLDPR